MTNQKGRVDEREREMSSLRSGASGSSGTQSSLSSSSLTSPSMTTRSQSSNNNGSSSSNKSKTMNTLSLLDVDHHHVGRRGGGDRHLTCSVTGSSSDLKIGGGSGAGGYSLEPKTPNDKLNTPRTVTMHNTFFPSSPAPLVENDIGMSFNFIQNF